jgi:hypothetical protein
MISMTLGWSTCVDARRDDHDAEREPGAVEWLLSASVHAE